MNIIYGPLSGTVVSVASSDAVLLMLSSAIFVEHSDLTTLPPTIQARPATDI